MMPAKKLRDNLNQEKPSTSKAIKPELKQQNPSQPWLWRDDWATGEIPAGNFRSLIGVVAFAVVWNAFSWTLTILMLPGELRDENYLVLLALLFPMAGIMLAVMAFRAVGRHLKFGVSTFLLAGDTGVVGGPLAGVIRVSTKLKPKKGFRLTLNCMSREVRGTGKNRRVSEKILWQSMQTMTRELSEGNPNETGVPVQFAIPFDAVPSSEGGANREGILWKLEIAADAPGIDYHAEFDVPVFTTDESSASFVADNSLVADFVHVPETDEVYREAGLVRTQTPAALEIVFSRFRDAKSAASVTTMAILWFGMTATMAFAMFNFGSTDPIGIFGLMFVSVFCLFGLILVALAVELWLWMGKIRISNCGIESVSGITGFSKTQLFDFDQIAAITFKRSMQSGQTIYHDLRVESLDGEEHVIGKRIVNEASVRKIVDDINEQLALYGWRDQSHGKDARQTAKLNADERATGQTVSI